MRGDSMASMAVSRGARGAWVVTAGIGVFIGAILVSCKSRDTGDLKRLKGTTVAMYLGRLKAEPRRVFSGNERIGVQVYADPEVVDLKRVRQYVLWLRPEQGDSWQRREVAHPDELPFIFQAEEGVYGLRASVLYRDGKEDLLPKSDDAPLVWLCVDRSPPALTWLSPTAGARVKARSLIDLCWSAEEMQFGKRAVELQWSGDGGATWKPIAEVRPRTGENCYRWRVPAALSGEVVVRVQATDLIGHAASSNLVLSFPQPAPEGAGETPATTDIAAATPPAAPEAGGAQPGAKDDESAAPTGTAAPPAAADEGASDAGKAAIVRLEPFEQSCFRGGSLVPLLWQMDLAQVTPETRARIEFSPDGNAVWQLQGEVDLGEGGFEFHVPEVTVPTCRLRLALEHDGEEQFFALADDFAIDSAAPAIVVKELPQVSGRELVVDLAPATGSALDSGCGGLAAVTAFLRPDGGKNWREVPRESAVLDSENARLRVNLDGFPEGLFDLFVLGEDGAGNRAPLPDESTAASGRFELDLTPPALALEAPSVQWVAGFPAQLRLAFDAAECVPPLVVEGRAGEGEWNVLKKFDTLTGVGEQIDFTLPAGVERFSVRLSVADKAGNIARAALGPLDPDKAIELTSFREARSYVAYSAEKITWKLHPVVAEESESLRIAIEHQRGAGGEWKPLYDDLTPQAECYWELPEGSEEEHRLRVRLFRAELLLGEDLSVAFRIAALDDATADGVSDESVRALERARTDADLYAERLGGPVPGTARDELVQLARSAEKAFRAAFAADERNFEAAYGLAQHLHRVDPERTDEVIEWLERTVKLRPRHAFALNDLGAAYIQRGEYSRAAEVLVKSLAVEDAPMTRYNLGLARFYEGKWAEARSHLVKALGNDGGVPPGDVHAFVIYTYLQEANHDQARALFEEHQDEIPAELRADITKRLGKS